MKILTSADIHISDYHQYNIEPGFRLEQFNRLADRFVDIIKSNDIDLTIIAGDLIHVPVLRPHVQHAVWNFIKKVAAVSPVIITVGNHDADSKNHKLETEASIINLLNDLPNVRVVNKEVLIYDNIKFGFQSWLPDHPLDWYDGKVDILINHFTDVGEGWDGQVIDESRFDLMFFGDIHKAYAKDKIVSIGNPLGHRLGDLQDGVVLILDTFGKDGEYKRVVCNNERVVSWDWVKVIDPGRFDFLRMYRPDKLPENAGQYKYDIEVPYQLSATNSTISADLVRSIDPEQVVGKYVKDFGLQSSHDEVVQRLNKSGYVPSTTLLDFQLISMEVKNFRSIESVELSFNGGVTLLAGNIGSGKSSIMSCIEYALLGNARIGTQVRDDSDGEMYVDLVLFFGGVYYRIKRGNGQLTFWVGNEDQVRHNSYLDQKSDNYHTPQPGNSIRDISAEVWNKLTFLEHWNLMYINQMSVGLFASMSQSDRISMISKVFGWDVVENYHSTASDIMGEYNQTRDSQDRKSADIRSKIVVLESLGVVVDNVDYDSLIESNKLRINEIRDIQHQFIKMEEYERTLDSEVKRKNGLDLTLPVYTGNGDPDRDEKLASDSIIDIECHIRSLEEANSVLISDTQSDFQNIQVHKHQLVQLANDERELVSLIKLLDELSTEVTNKREVAKELGKLLGHAGPGHSCNYCKQSLSTPESVAEYSQSIMTKIKEINSEVNSIQVKYDLSNQRYVELNKIDYQTSNKELNLSISNLEESINNRKKVIDQNQSIITSRKSEIQSHREVIQKVNMHRASMTALDSRIKMNDELETSIKELNEVIKSFDSLKQYSKDELTKERTTLLDQNTEYTVKMTQASECRKRIDQIEVLKSDQSDLDEEITETLSKMGTLQQYLDLMNRNGVVVRSILETCAELLSTEELKVTTVRELGSGELAPDLSLAMVNSGGKLIPYNNLSGGQLFLADIRFLLSLIEVVGGTGVLLLDEVFKYMPTEYIDILAGEIKDSKARDIIIVTHADSYPLNDRVINAQLNSSGVSEYSVYSTH